ncbi:MAG: CPBP family intramembrane metalloprotease [Flavobacteriaceae bacterium]|nr:CPBP family intramembrane metalloprotease [Flavobacteriaceae bacterium]
MKRIFIEIYQFIKNPIDERIENRSFSKMLKYIGVIYIIKILIFLTILVPLMNVLQKVEPLKKAERLDYFDKTLLFQVLIGVILVPIIEELIFRFFLRYNKFFKLFLSRNKWDFIFKYLVYFSILAFGLAHSSNYENNSWLFYLLIPFIVSSQLINGAFMTFLRVKFNIFTSMFFHILWNCTMFGLFHILSPSLYTYNQQQENYSVTINEVPYFSKGNQFFEIDSKEGKIFKINIKEYSANHILDTLNINKLEYRDVLINFDLKSEKGIPKTEINTILNDFIVKRKENSLLH